MVVIIFTIYIFETIDVAAKISVSSSKLMKIFVVIVLTLLNLSQVIAFISPLEVLCLAGISEAGALPIFAWAGIMFLYFYAVLYLGFTSQLFFSLFAVSFLKTKKIFKIIITIGLVAILFGITIILYKGLELYLIFFYSLLFTPSLPLWLTRKRG